MSVDIAPPYTDEQLAGDSVSKKDLVTFLQTSASIEVTISHSHINVMSQVNTQSTI